MAKKENNKLDRVYYGMSILSTILLFIAVIAYLFGFIGASEKVFIIFIFAFGIELGIRIAKIMGV